MKETRFKLQYTGSKFWLIFWFIICFPVALVLLMTSSACQVNHTTYHFNYEGSRFWLCFWTIFFFPIAFVLLFVNGVSALAKTPAEPLSS